MSIHALQITNHVGTTQIQVLPNVNFFGFYPTWETVILQVLLIVIIFIVAMREGKIKLQQDLQTR